MNIQRTFTKFYMFMLFLDRFVGWRFFGISVKVIIVFILYVFVFTENSTHLIIEHNNRILILWWNASLTKLIED